MARDYRAEERRRNERARALGFSSRAQMRRALRQGRVTPQRGRNKTITAVVRPAAPPRPAETQYGRAGYDNVTGYRSARREAKAWSDAHSRVPQSRYSPSYQGEQFRRYYDAYVNPSTRANRIENGLASLRDWLVGEMHYYDAAEFDEKYHPGEVS